MPKNQQTTETFYFTVDEGEKHGAEIIGNVWTKKGQNFLEAASQLPGKSVVRVAGTFRKWLLRETQADESPIHKHDDN